MKNYVAKLTASDEGFIDFLTGFLHVSKSHTHGDRVVKKHFSVPHERLLDFIDASELAMWIKRTREILANNDQLHERCKKALEVFVDENDNPDSYRSHR